MNERIGRLHNNESTEFCLLDTKEQVGVSIRRGQSVIFFNGWKLSPSELSFLISWDQGTKFSARSRQKWRARVLERNALMLGDYYYGADTTRTMKYIIDRASQAGILTSSFQELLAADLL